MFPFYFKCGRLVSRLLELRNLLLCWSGFFLSVTKCLVFFVTRLLTYCFGQWSMFCLHFDLLWLGNSFLLLSIFVFCFIKKKKSKLYTFQWNWSAYLFLWKLNSFSLSFFFFFYSYRGNWYTLGIKSASELATFWFGGGGVCNFALEKWPLLGMLTLNATLGGGIVT